MTQKLRVAHIMLPLDKASVLDDLETQLQGEQAQITAILPASAAAVWRQPLRRQLMACSHTLHASVL